ISTADGEFFVADDRIHAVLASGTQQERELPGQLSEKACITAQIEIVGWCLETLVGKFVGVVAHIAYAKVSSRVDCPLPAGSMAGNPIPQRPVEIPNGRLHRVIGID